MLFVFSTSFLFSFSQETKSNEGNKKTWNGFDRYDFVMDSISFEISPFQAGIAEGAGNHEQVPGKVRCLIVVLSDKRLAAPVMCAVKVLITNRRQKLNYCAVVFT